MRIKAILWDGFTRINGFLEIEKNRITFHCIDFNDSSLTLNIPFDEIEVLKHYRLFSQDINGIEVISKDGKKNVFVVEEAKKLYTLIKVLLKSTKANL